jgi:hypothetical protein
MAKVATSIAPALFLMLTLASFICAAGETEFFLQSRSVRHAGAVPSVQA